MSREHLPLDGVRVIECCGIWAGPYMGQLLADLGAEVVKVEWFDRYDRYRTRGVERLRSVLPERVHLEMSRSFHSINRNKVGLTVDLKRPEGIGIMHDLVRRSDALIDNYTVGVLDRLGLSYEECSSINPDVTTVSLSGFGEGSPLQPMRAYGLVLSGMSGLEDMIRDGEEFMGSPTFIISDPSAAIFGAMGTLLGVLRARAGLGGMRVDVSQFEAMIALADGLQEFGAQVPPHRSRPAADGRFVMERSSGPQPGDPVAHVLPLEGGYASDYYADLPIRVAVDHPIAGPEELVASPWRHNGARAAVRKPAPALGEGNLYVLHHVLGYDFDRIDRLMADGVVAKAGPS